MSNVTQAVVCCRPLSNFPYFQEQGIASFPGLPTIQFLIACSMQKWRGRPCIFYYVNDISVYLGRQSGGGGGVPHCILRTRFCFEPEVVRFSLHERLKPQRLGQKLQDKASSLPQARLKLTSSSPQAYLKLASSSPQAHPKLVLSMRDPSTPLGYLGRH